MVKALEYYTVFQEFKISDHRGCLEYKELVHQHILWELKLETSIEVILINLFADHY